MKNRFSWLSLICFFSCFLVVPLYVNWRLRRINLPDYATWNGGLRDLDYKFRQLEWISERGTVDSIFLGSSVQDGGVSAEAFTEELQKLHVKESNSYNFALPAVGPAFWPSIYRLIRLTTKPKRIFVGSGVTGLGARDPSRLKIIAGPKLPRKAGEGKFLLNAVDYFSGSPAGQVVQNSFFLKFMVDFWRTPILEKSAAIKDLFVFGRFASLPGSSSDFIARSGHGDGISYFFSPYLKIIQDWRRNYKEGLRVTADCIKTAPTDEERKLCFFTDDDLRAINEFLFLAKKDGVEVIYVPLESTAGFLPVVRADPTIMEDRRLWHTEFARVYHLPMLYFLDDFVIYPFELADGVHLNYLAALRYGRMLARNWAKAQGLKISNVAQNAKIPFYYSFEQAEQDALMAPQELNKISGFVILKDQTSQGSTLELSLYPKTAFSLNKTYTFEFFTPDRKSHYVRAVDEELGFFRLKLPFVHGDMAVIGRVVEVNEKTGNYDPWLPVSIESVKWTDS